MLTKLPTELVPGFFDEKDEASQSTLTLSCQFFNKAIQPQRLFNKLLHHVVYADQRKIATMLQLHPEFLTWRATFRDLSGRTFHDSTLFEYFCWAYDTHMIAMVVRGLFSNVHPENHAFIESIRKNICQQMANLELSGLRYSLNGQCFQSAHYDFALFNALQEFQKNYNCWENPDEARACWSNKVGGMQWLVPAHVAQHYCSNDFSNPVSIYNNHVELSRSLVFYNTVTKTSECWFEPGNAHTGLGRSFAIVYQGSIPVDLNQNFSWGPMQGARGTGLARLALDEDNDALAIDNLARMRIAEYAELGKILKFSIPMPELVNATFTVPG